MFRKWIIFLLLSVFVGNAVLLEARRYPACTEDCHRCNMTLRQWRREMDEIDWALIQLRDMQRRYRSQALIHMDQGVRWQFEDGQFTESRKALAEAELEQQVTHVIQRKLDFLEKRREFLLKCRF